MNRIIYYYQTFTGLKSILNSPKYTTHIHVSSIHFGNNKDGSPYIHLNDHEPSNKIFDNVWKELKLASDKGIKIVLMIGGAGGAFENLFSKKLYYSLLYNTIKKYPFISGVDLNRRVCKIAIKKLIKKLDSDFGNEFIISMAPIQNSLESDTPGMGGFVYKDLYKSKIGDRINYFNGHFISLILILTIMLLKMDIL